MTRLAWAVLLAAGLVSGLEAAELAGRVSLLDRGVPATDVENAVVYWQPQSGAGRLPTRDSEVRTEGKRFIPRVLPVTAGSRVRFPNGDPILHNVFSVSPGNRFDLGLYRTGAGKSTVFESAGLVRAYCNVHHSMIAYILVLDTPHYAAVDASGRFTIPGVPPGPGTLTVWHERAERWSQPIAVPQASPIEVHMETNLGQLPPHLNKFGKPYDQDRRGDDYR